MKIFVLVFAAALLPLIRCGAPSPAGTADRGLTRRVSQASASGDLQPAVALPDRREADSLCEVASRQMLTADYAGAAATGRLIERLARDRADRSMLLRAYACKGQALLAADSTTEAHDCLKRGLQLWNEFQAENGGRADEAIFTIYNALGIHAINVELNYAQAIDYFLRGMELSRQHGDERQYVVFSSNLVVAHFLRNDPDGLRYAQDVYDFGVENDVPYARFSGSFTSALMYYLRGEYGKAEEVMRETLALVDSFFDRTGVYNFQANILSALGRREEAARYYDKALACVDGENAMTVSYTYLCAGSFYLDAGQTQRAAGLLREGIRVAQAGHAPVFVYRLHEALARACAATGDYRTALDHYRAYREGAERVFDTEREYVIRDLQMKYRTATQERRIEQDRLRMERQRRRLQAAAALLLLLCVTLLFIGRLYRNRSRLYRRIVEQWQQTLRREEQLRARIETLERQDAPVRSDEATERERALFLQIDSLMRREELYREKGLTRERVAELCGTNRTTLSQVVNRCTGMGFNPYVNRFRIEEAVRLLSDPAQDIPLKALVRHLGFSSATTFYDLFRTTVGIPPARYRSTILAMKRESGG